MPRKEFGLGCTCESDSSRLSNPSDWPGHSVWRGMLAANNVCCIRCPVKACILFTEKFQFCVYSQCPACELFDKRPLMVAAAMHKEVAAAMHKDIL